MAWEILKKKSALGYDWDAIPAIRISCKGQVTINAIGMAEMGIVEKSLVQVMLDKQKGLLGIRVASSEDFGDTYSLKMGIGKKRGRAAHTSACSYLVKWLEANCQLFGKVLPLKKEDGSLIYVAELHKEALEHESPAPLGLGGGPEDEDNEEDEDFDPEEVARDIERHRRMP